MVATRVVGGGGGDVRFCPFCGEAVTQVLAEHGVFYCIHNDLMLLFVNDDTSIFRIHQIKEEAGTR